MEENFEELKEDLVEHMITQVHKNQANGVASDGRTGVGDGEVQEQPGK